jgi:hypothetical protein
MDRKNMIDTLTSLRGLEKDTGVVIDEDGKFITHTDLQSANIWYVRGEKGFMAETAMSNYFQAMGKSCAHFSAHELSNPLKIIDAAERFYQEWLKRGIFII